MKRLTYGSKSVGVGRPTLNDIARRAGVSKSTVSLVLRDSPLVNARTRERVRKAIAKLGYVYNRGAASLRSQRTNTIGLVVNDVTNPFYGEFTAAFDAVLEREGWVTLFGNSGEAPGHQQKIVERMREQGVEGIVVCPARDTPAEFIHSLRRAKVPCVQATRYVTDRNADYVGQQNCEGMEMATEHLIGLGHRRISFIGDRSWNSSAVDRIRGYRNALIGHGIEPDPRLVIACEASPDAAAQAVAVALALDPAPTATVCANDVVAIGVLKGLHDLHLVPGVDFAVVGFDNLRETAYWQPALSTVAISAEAVAFSAANLLLRRIGNPDGGSEWIEIPPVRMVIRDSCGSRLRQGFTEAPVAAL